MEIGGVSGQDARRVVEAHRAEGEYVEVQGLRVFYRHAGEKSGTPLVLTHGIPRSSFLYRKMIPILSRHHEVYAPDLYGFGLSDKPPEAGRYRFPRFERFLGDFLDCLGIRRSHLICHDVGGPFTIGYAIRNPDRVASLTISDTTVFFRGFRIPGPVLASIISPLPLQRRFARDPRFMDLMLAYMQRKALRDPDGLTGAEGEAWKELISRDGGLISLACTLKAYRLVLPYAFRIQRALRDFARPTLVLWGKHDPYCTLPVACEFVRRIPDSEIQVIYNAAHFIQEDAPEDAAWKILDFIKRKEPEA